MNISVEGCSRWSCQAGGKEEICGCGERGNADSSHERNGYRGQVEMKEDDLLQYLLEKYVGTAKSGRKTVSIDTTHLNMGYNRAPLCISLKHCCILMLWLVELEINNQQIMTCRFGIMIKSSSQQVQIFQATTLYTVSKFVREE